MDKTDKNIIQLNKVRQVDQKAQVNQIALIA